MMTAGSKDLYAITVEGVSKLFPLYAAPRDRLKQFILPRLQRLVGSKPRQYYREFWALRDLSFQIRKGETVGIIGRNGAGKSTLLQIICGTLEPTSGAVQTNGRVAALLELGAGFNPEFSGRENIYMNGAILGLSQEEISARYDEIVAFADIGDHIDQPVKSYSSGMYVRLAFAVQACVEPDILIVDEALAVGDIGFQYKCFKRMEALRAKGVTILMVTHATGSILEYADRCIVIEDGRVARDTNDVLAAVLAYEKGMLSEVPDPLASHRPQPATAPSLDELRAIQATDRQLALGEKRFGSGRAIIEGVSILKSTGTGGEVPVIQPGEEVVFRFQLRSADEIRNVALGISLSKVQGGDIWGDNNLNAGTPIDLGVGACVVDYRVRLPIAAGEYLVHCGLACWRGEGDQGREELDQRRPVARLRIWSTRAQVGVVHAPIRVEFREGAQE